jgi:hypothetical protein
VEDRDVKRPALALSAGFLLLALLPGSTLASFGGVLDQSDTTVTAIANSSSNLAQTFTAGKTGLLTNVQLYMASSSGSLNVTVETTSSGLPSGVGVANSNPATPTTTAGWVDFSFPAPPAVTSGVMYAIVFNLSSLGGVPSADGTTADTYPGGQALVYSGSSWVSVNVNFSDFAFKTYVDPQTTTLQWDKTQVVGGVTTSLTLAETVVFPGLVDPVVKQDALPSWFTVTGVACSSQIAAADCILANVAPGSSLTVTPNGNPITVTLTGTASPALAAIGTVGTGKAEGCMDYLSVEVVTPAQPAPTLCVAGQTDVAVMAAPSPTTTPPPTATGGSRSSNEPGSSIWWLPIGLIGLLSGALLLLNRQRRLVR